MEFSSQDRLQRLQSLAERVFGDAARARDGLRAPKARLDGMTPMDFAADSADVDALEDWLREIDHGYFACGLIFRQSGRA